MLEAAGVKYKTERKTTQRVPPARKRKSALKKKAAKGHCCCRKPLWLPRRRSRRIIGFLSARPSSRREIQVMRTSPIFARGQPVRCNVWLLTIRPAGTACDLLAFCDLALDRMKVTMVSSSSGLLLILANRRALPLASG